MYPDFVLRRELKKLEVYCDYRAQGCQEIVTWGTLQVSTLYESTVLVHFGFTDLETEILEV